MMTHSRSATGAPPVDRQGPPGGPWGNANGPARPDPRRSPGRSAALLRGAILLVAALALLWMVFGLYTAGQPLVALGVLAFGVAVLAIYGTAR
jgi:hypothetical protein